MTDTNATRHAKPVPFHRVQLTDKFWRPRQIVNGTSTLQIQYGNLISTGRIEALKLNWKPGDPNQPHIFWDSDVAKWIEAACYILAGADDAELSEKVETVVGLLEKAQQPDGYLNAHFTVVEPESRWKNLRDNHELYCAGHLIEAAVAHYAATGSEKLLIVAMRYVDRIDADFGIGDGKIPGYCGHPEIELALAKLFEATGERRYLQLAQYFVDERGRPDPHFFDLEAVQRGEDPASYWAKDHVYCQADVPVRQLERVAGHAVRAMYLYAAMADLVRLTADESLQAVLNKLWQNLTACNMYLTGGIGPSASNEGFVTDYHLPNETAYAETCASVGLIFWAHRMLLLDTDSRYADVMERALYNGSISGVSLDGTKFLYENPLASDGTFHRKEWFDCSCCPPNIARLTASVGGYAFSQDHAGIAVHLYVQGTANFEHDGHNIQLDIQTDYPWDGAIQLTINTAQENLFALNLRIPGWCRDYQVKVNGDLISLPTERGYIVIERRWQAGDFVELNLAMPVEYMQANPKVLADAGRIALQRGPIVYCFEEVDNPFPISNLALDPSGSARTVWEPDVLGGIVSIECVGHILSGEHWDGQLYRPFDKPSASVCLRAVPYAVWDNRQPGQMSVWLPCANFTAAL